MTSRPLTSLSLPRSTLSALTRAGYETLDDLSTSSAETLARDLNIPLSSSQAIFSFSQKPRNTLTFPLTQSAASMVTASKKFSTFSEPVDKLLLGGLSRGNVLEISGPPGTPKEALAVSLVRSFVEADEEVLFLDAQNMTSPAKLNKALRNCPSVPPNFQKLIYHINIHTLPDFMVFIHNLSSFLETHPKVGLLVINSISFPFQAASSLTFSAKNALLDQVKHAFAKACASRNLSVVTTSQLATKLVNADGSAGSFDTGSRGIMVPQLGPGYLPPGRAYRLIFAPDTRGAGFVRLISSPTHQRGQGSPPQERYIQTAFS